MRQVSICWFRQDLRLADNPALIKASKHNYVLPIYILDNINAQEYALGSASCWWLHYSLISLNNSLGGNLSIYKEDPIKIFNSLIRRFDIAAIYWNRCYEPWQTKRDAAIKKALQSKGLHIESSNGSLLWEPWTISKNNGKPYKVFTPFYKKGCLQSQEPSNPVKKPSGVKYIHDTKGSLEVTKLELLPKKKWYKKFENHWLVGEKNAKKRLDTFVKEVLNNYKDGRNIPSKPYVSRLSPHLHFGEISPNQIWHTVRKTKKDENVDHFCSELGWREFSYSQLYYNSELPTKNLQPKFDTFSWIENKKTLEAWQKGKTGIPMVDAGMRELWQTGYMNNRVRMIAGSFLVKNLRLNWRHGERWFWDTLLDADLANNSVSWQWIAGCGLDAAPYFRIFNPITQGQKFDPHGIYIRKFIPEISSLPDRYLFSPWEAPEAILKKSSIILGKTYPLPIVDLKKSRKYALEAFQRLKEEQHE